MKDNKQNLTDLIGALAVDIEEIKKKLDAKDSPDKNEALKRLEAKLEPVIRFFNGNAPENVNAIFGSKEAIEDLCSITALLCLLPCPGGLSATVPV